MRYEFKLGSEAVWFVLITAGIYILLHLSTLDPDGINDWWAWGVALGGGVLRAAAGAGLAVLRKSPEDWPDPDDVVAKSD